MSDDGRELEKPYRKLVEALIGLADVPLSSGDGKRDLAHAAARAIQRIANPWLELQVGNVESNTAAILKEIRDHFYMTGEGGMEGTIDAVMAVLARRIAVLEGQTRVIREPQMTMPYQPAPAAAAAGQSSAYSESRDAWASARSKALGATRVTLRNRLGDQWSVDDVPEGALSVTTRRSATNERGELTGALTEVQFMLDESCRKYGIRGKDRVFVEPPQQGDKPSTPGLQPSDPDRVVLTRRQLDEVMRTEFERGRAEHRSATHTINEVRRLVGAGTDEHTLEAVQQAIHRHELARLNVLLAVGDAVGLVPPLPHGSPAHAEAVFEAVKKLRTKADRVCPEFCAVRWTDDAGEHEQIMGLEMAVVALGNLRTEFAAFQKKHAELCEMPDPGDETIESTGRCTTVHMHANVLQRMFQRRDREAQSAVLRSIASDMVGRAESLSAPRKGEKAAE